LQGHAGRGWSRREEVAATHVAGNFFAQMRAVWLSTNAKCGQASRFESIGRRFKQTIRRAIKRVRRGSTTGSPMRVESGQAFTLRRGHRPTAIRCESVSRHWTAQPARFNWHCMPRRLAISRSNVMRVLQLITATPPSPAERWGARIGFATRAVCPKAHSCSQSCIRQSGSNFVQCLSVPVAKAGLVRELCGYFAIEMTWPEQWLTSRGILLPEIVIVGDERPAMT
jgi:hypothetical protein